MLEYVNITKIMHAQADKRNVGVPGSRSITQDCLLKVDIWVIPICRREAMARAVYARNIDR